MDKSPPYPLKSRCREGPERAKRARDPKRQQRWTPPKWFCHALPERCFRWRGHPLPLCARCTAIYPALATGIAVGLLLNPPPLRALAVALLLVAPLVVDGMTQSLGWRESRNSLRFATGLLYGFACGICVEPLLTILRGGLGPA